ncbi:hypothetical protein ACFCZ3_19925 [Cellulosimicrobium cellulans]|uniref:hypothetical protein n=1 Tax=Cellulosimicrobium cellulans TaxID=1710 RepID=UPI0035E1DC10
MSADLTLTNPPILAVYLTIAAVTAAYGIVLDGRVRDDNETTVILNIAGALLAGWWPVGLPLLVWAHARHRKERRHG